LPRCFTATDWQRLQHLAVERGLAGVCVGMIEAAQATFGADFVAVPADLTSGAAARRPSREWLDATRLRDWRYMQSARPSSPCPPRACALRWLWQQPVAQPRLHGVSVWPAGSGLLGPDRHPRPVRQFRRFLGQKVSG
jgi:hypothetical protein